MLEERDKGDEKRTEDDEPTLSSYSPKGGTPKHRYSIWRTMTVIIVEPDKL
jgi:hypothetical protein